MADVQIDFAVLNQMAIAMKQVVVEVGDADEQLRAVRDAVDQPFPGRSELAETVEEAGELWAYRRSLLVQRATSAALRMDAVGMAWQDWDAGAGVAPDSALPPLDAVG